MWLVRIFLLIFGVIVFITILSWLGGEETYDGISVNELAGIFEKDGFTVTKGKMPSGEPFLVAVMGKSWFQVNLYHCEGERKCQDIQFGLSFQNVRGASLEMMNNWNMKTRMTKAYMQERDPAIEMDIPIKGATKEYHKTISAPGGRLLEILLGT